MTRESVTAPPILDVRGVTVRYGGVVAVDNASLRVYPDEIVALIGPNGAGKTSLFNAVAGVVKPVAGSVRLDGVPIDGYAPHERARLGLARTFQGVRLFRRLTVRENLVLARHRHGRSGLFSAMVTGSLARHERDEANRVADELIEAVGLEEFAELPCSALPYGVQRVVEVTRALCAEPGVLLLDEPSAGLDPSESSELASMVQRIRDALGIPVLLIEHDMSFVMSISDYVYVLDFGVPLGHGTPAEVRSNPAVVAAYLGEDVLA